MAEVKSYSEKLKDPRWQKKRLEILNRDSWKCQLCFDDKNTLHIHHLKYTNIDPWNELESDLITYCKYCHSLVEFEKKNEFKLIISETIKFENENGIVINMCAKFHESNGIMIYKVTKDESLEIAACFGPTGVKRLITFINKKS